MPFPIYPRRHSNHHHQQRQRHQAKILIASDPQDFEVVLHRLICAPLPSSPTLRAWNHADSQLHQATRVTPWRARDLMVMDSMTMARRGPAVHTLIVAGHSKISRPICLPINPRDPRNAQLPIALITTRDLLANTTKTVTL